MLSKSSGLKTHRAATDKLRDLDFDPIEQFLQELERLNDMIDREQNNKNPRWSYLEKLYSLRVKVIETLLPYRYGKAPITTVEHEDARDTIQIVLTSRKELDD